MLCFFFVFFFFKQKTAYELRIIDWSSDVCSSDLPPPQYSYVRSHLPSVVGAMVVMPGRPPPISVLPLPMLTVAPGTSTTGLLQEEIRRASCRERVCKYG